MISNHFWIDVYQHFNEFFDYEDIYDEGRKLKVHNIDLIIVQFTQTLIYNKS